MSCGNSSNVMPVELLIRPLVVDDLAAYKALRDEMLALHPEAFTPDAATQQAKPAGSYAARLGLEQGGGAQFTLGAWRGGQLVGAVSCEREARLKTLHIGHLVGMMVRPEARGQGAGRALVTACIARARQARGLEMLTLSVTSGNLAALALYEAAGFRRYGRMPRAMKLDGRYHDKDLMVLDL